MGQYLQVIKYYMDELPPVDKSDKSFLLLLTCFCRIPLPVEKFSIIIGYIIKLAEIKFLINK